MKKLINFICTIALAFLFASCGTTLSSKVQRPAELDLGTAKSIAVVPFTAEKQSTDFLFGFIQVTNTRKQNEIDHIASYLTESIQTKIAESEYYELISSYVVKNAIEKNQQVPCDVFLTGYFSDFENEVKHERISEKDSEGNVKYHTEYSRRVNLKFNYEVIDSKTNRIVATSNETLSSTSSRYKSEGSVPDSFSMIQNQLDKISIKIIKKIQPYYETVYVSLMSDKTKDPEMARANKLAKDGNLEEAKNLFFELYQTQEYMEAGYNTAIILQNQGKLYEAKKIMSDVDTIYENKKVKRALMGINSEIRSYEKLQNQKNARDNSSGLEEEDEDFGFGDAK